MTVHRSGPHPSTSQWLSLTRTARSAVTWEGLDWASVELWLSQDGQLGSSPAVGDAHPQAGVTLGTSGSLFLCGTSLVSTDQSGAASRGL